LQEKSKLYQSTGATQSVKLRTPAGRDKLAVDSHRASPWVTEDNRLRERIGLREFPDKVNFFLIAAKG